MLAEQTYSVPDFSGKNRLLSHPPTPEIVHLANDRDDFFSEEEKKERDARLCYRVTLNFVGSLLVQHHIRDLATNYEESQTPLPPELAVPFEVIEGAPLFQFNKNGPKYQNLGVQTGPILVKYACGKMAGVVLQGPYAGLILDRKDDASEPYEGMTISRVFNDSPLTTGHFPENPFFNIHSYKIKSSAFAQARKEYDPYYEGANLERIRLFDGIYKQFVHDTTSLFRSEVWLSEAFFLLAEQLQIPVDTRNFHYSRADKGI